MAHSRLLQARLNVMHTNRASHCKLIPDVFKAYLNVSDPFKTINKVIYHLVYEFYKSSIVLNVVALCPFMIKILMGSIPLLVPTSFSNPRSIKLLIVVFRLCLSLSVAFEEL